MTQLLWLETLVDSLRAHLRSQKRELLARKERLKKLKRTFWPFLRADLTPKEVDSALENKNKNSSSKKGR